MASLSKREVRLIETLINLKQNDTKKALSEFLANYYSNVIETPDYVIATGNIPIALCAHLDTVWEGYKGERKHMYYDRYKECMWCPEGAGFDDKVGIFLIIKIITSGLKPNIILCCNEETGGLGAHELSKLNCPFPDLKYCIELDRMGSNDCVFYSCDNKDFEKYVESFGFKTNYGSFTDICQYCPAWGVAGVNLSVGYIDEHTTCERLYVKSMLRTLSRVKQMLQAEDIPFFEYVPAYYSYGKYFGRWGSYPTDEDDYEAWFDGEYMDHKVQCECCKKYWEIDLMFPVIGKDKKIHYRCYNCLDDTVAWCDYCHEPFEIEKDEIEYVCPKCKEIIYYGETGRSETDSEGCGAGHSMVPATNEELHTV